MLKAFYCDSDETELYAAQNATQAAGCYSDLLGGDEPDEGYPRELTNAELDAPMPEFDEDEKQTGGTTTIRKMLAEHGDESGWFAGSNV